MSRYKYVLFVIALCSMLSLQFATHQAKQLKHAEFLTAVALSGPAKVLVQNKEQDELLQIWFQRQEEQRDRISSLHRLLAILTAIAFAGLVATLMIPKQGRQQ